ncbi:MAG: class I SAM-dependent methyltransferase [Acidipila sp.]|nr:class I SAM-dependent methyltransferase [Acidipila sp.]
MFATDEYVIIHDGEWTDGCISPLERYLLAHLIHYFKPKVLLEVGTYRGCTTRIFHDNALEGAQIYTVDLPPKVEAKSVPHASDLRLIDTRDVGVVFSTCAADGRCQIHQIFGNTFDPQTWGKLPEHCDFIFIDASHTYEAVRNDTRQALKHCGPRTVVVWHDYSEHVTVERGVGRFIRELMRERSDIFICPDTTLAILIPAEEFKAGQERVQTFLRTTESLVGN